MIPLIAGLRELAPRYDGFIIDLWGVLHDGVTPYPGATGALAGLAGKPVLLLSNAPRRAMAVRDTLRRIGIADRLYTSILTSGEAVWQGLRDRTDAWFAGLGSRVYHLGPPRDLSVVEGLSVTLAATPDAADVLLNTGPDDDRDPTALELFLPELRACLDAGLPMICANPDLHVMRAGIRLLCAGALAEWYAGQGGEVRSLGKPYPDIYATSLGMLGLPAGRVLAIGDSLRTDIAGAQGAGIDSLWVLGGLHADALQGDLARARALATEYRVAPTAMMQSFTW